VYEMYPRWGEAPQPTPPVPPASAPPHPSLSAVQSSLDRRDNGGEAGKVRSWQR
jgi:hypothetical protein